MAITLATPARAWVSRRVLGLTVAEWIGLAGSLSLALLVGWLVATGRSEGAVAVAVGVPLAIIVAYSPTGGLLLWLAITPFFVQGESSDASPMTWLLFRLGIPAMILLVLTYWALGLRRLRLRIGMVDVLLLGFLVLGVTNVFLLSPNPERMSVAFFSDLAVPIFLFWLVRMLGVTERDIRALLLVALFTVGTQAAIGVASWLAPEVLPAYWLGRGGERTTGTFGGPGPFSITIVFFALLLLHGLRRTERSSGWRILEAGTVVAGLAAVALTLSRGSWLGAALAFLGLGLLYPRLLLRLAIGTGVVAVVLALTVLSEPFGAVQDRLEDADTVDNRLITNQAAVRMIGDRPLEGFGFGNFERYDEGYKTRVGDIPLQLGGSSHNTYLNFAAEFGLLGFALYFAVPVVLLARSVQRWSRLPRDGIVSRPLLAVLWLALLDQFVVSNFLEMVHGNTWGTLLWWLTLGLIAAVLEQHAKLDRPRRWSMPR
jgi:O-antigen ligase